MALPLLQIDFSIFGGGNWSDQPRELIQRAYQSAAGGFQQIAPVESPDMENIDFIERAIGKRKGSSSLDDYSSVLISGDTILKQIAWIKPNSTTEVNVACGAKGIYTDQSGSWARLTNANGTAFQFNTDATKASFVMVDNHLLIMTDTNYTQIYRTGTALDDQMNNQTTTTTVDADSNSGQKVVNVAATTMFNVGDRVALNLGGAREEFGYIASISAGVSITLENNLTNTHTSAQADVVQTQNQYTESKGGASQVYTGAWTSGHYIGFPLHQRFCMCQGDSVIEFTDTGQPWDLLGGNNFQADGNIVGAIPFVPTGGSELNAVGFLSTTAGPQFISGFDLTDTIKPMQGGRTALNHQVIEAIDNWIVYMTSEGGLEAVNFNQAIDLGRRFKTLDGVTGPMDTFTPTNSKHPTLPFSVANKSKKQVAWFYPDASQTTNSHAVVLDFYLGEPVSGEPIESFERRVRCLYWSIKEPGSNPWFISAYQKRGSMVGVLATGITYTMENGKNDLDTLPILEIYKLPNFDGGAPDNQKNWRKASASFKPKGNWNVKLRHYLDRASEPTGTETEWLQATQGAASYDSAVYDTDSYVTSGLVRRSRWTEAYSNEISYDLRNQNTSEDWVLTNFNQQYQIGAPQN